MSDRDRCPINRCGQPQGIGTWMTFGEGDLTVPVCEAHWQALRCVLRPDPSRGEVTSRFVPDLSRTASQSRSGGVS